MENVEDEMIAGGWRCLCIGVLLHAIQQVENGSKIFRSDSHRIGRASGTDKDAMFNRKAATKWLDGGRGLVTFEDCCEAMAMNPERAKLMILKRAWENRRIHTISEVTEAVW